MPELPEVETIRRGLQEKIPGARVEGILTSNARVFQADPRILEERLPGQTIRSLGRRGKFLLIHFDQDVLVVHLGMTGQVTVRDPELVDSSRFLRHPDTGLQRVRQHAPDRHTHLQIHFEDGRGLLYRDIRMFGRIHLVSDTESNRQELLGHLGPEPLSGDFTIGGFLAGFGGRKSRVKPLLLDQGFVAGLGNIYVDEALFAARIHPCRRANTLRRYEKERLFESIPGVLRKGLRYGGTSLRDYVDSDGVEGSNQEELNVYGREGQDCVRCQATVQKIVVSQRGTHFCPACQHRSRPVRVSGV